MICIPSPSPRVDDRAHVAFYDSILDRMNQSKDSDYLRWKGWSHERFGRLSSEQRRYYDWHVKRALGGAVCDRVLEIGFGNGEFLSYCRDRGWQVVGLELEEQLRDRARAAGFEVYAGLEDLPDMRFGLIALFDVLEHIPAAELATFLRMLRARLAPDGAILLRVPNGDSPFGRVFQHGDLTHVTTFGHLKLKQLAEMCGLQLVAKGEGPWHAQWNEGRTPRAWLRAVLRALLGKVISFAYYGWRVDLAPNLVAVLRSI